jgi:DNA-binding winged helix-turn-helix (wHTH) protein/tetratricopeptide (TPR) repeat protein
MQRPRALIYEFGEFQVDVDRRLLLGRDGRPLPLTPKVFDTLLYLVEHTETVLDKDTLMNAIWPSTAVEENSLNQNISLLRRVLGGKRVEHRYIVTVPGHGYRFVAPVRKHAPSTMTVSAGTIRSIAVLPFQPLVREERDVSLEMGMADTLIARLSGLRDMIVRPISCVSKYAGLGQDALLAGRELEVESVLEGSLQHRGNKIRVTVRLVSVPTGVSLWAGTFDEELTDIFALQDAISERVVRALALELSSEDKKRLIKHYTESAEAYELYLKGRYHWWKNSPEEFSKSRDYFHRAVDVDPSYALGYCGLNSYYGFGAAFGMLPAAEAWPKAEWAIRKALDLDNTLAEAHLGLAALNMVHYLDWVGAEKEAKRAIELNPRFDEIHFMYSFFLVVMRRFDEAITEGKRALACDPFSVRISQHLGSAFYNARRYDEAIRQYRRTLELDPHNASVHESLGAAYEQSGRYRDAIEQWKKAAALVEDAELGAILGAADAKHNFDGAVRAVAAKRLGRLTDLKRSGHYVPGINFARAYLRMDDKPRALQWLKTSCEERNVFALLLGSDPFYDPLRADRHFISLLRRMKLCV